MTQQAIGEQLKSNWMIIIFIGSLIVGWTTFNARLTQAENEIDQLSQVVTQINQINISLAEMRRDISYIKSNIK